MYPKSSYKKWAYLCGSSILLMIFGITLICVRSVLYNAILSNMIVMPPNSNTYELWRKNPLPLELKLYLFNWTNPQDIYNSSVKPKFNEMGPYTFDETKEASNITWNDNNNTVSYYNLKKWWFNASKSKGNLTDLVTAINTIALASAFTVRDWNYLMRKALNVFLNSASAKINVTHTAGEYLFEGYEDTLLTMSSKMPNLGGVKIPNFDRFGWFYTRNASEMYEGQFNMDTGVSGGQLGALRTWKYMESTPYFPDHCGIVQGSAGVFFPTNLNKTSIIKFFSPDLCRYVELEFEKEEYINGLLGYKYSASDRFLDNGTKIPENKCFCNGDCMPYGALDVSACRYGTPTYVSLPHFNKADPYYTSLIEGIKPNKDKHDFFMTFEPNTAVPLQVAARLQVNLLLQPIYGIGMFENAPRVYIPALWFEQCVTITKDISFYIAILINLKVACIAIGSIIIFFSIIMQICCCYSICTSKMLIKKQNSLIKFEEKLPLKCDSVKNSESPQ